MSGHRQLRRARLASWSAGRVTALGVLPLAIGMGEPGREIKGPMAVVILGGLLTSMALNLLVLPTLALRYGRFKAEDEFPRLAHV